MDKYRISILMTVLVLSSLACQALAGGGADDTPPGSSSDGGSTVPADAPTSMSDSAENDNNTSDSEFPMTADAYNVIDVGDGTVLYYTKLPLEDVMNFYRNEYRSRGYTENELLTVVSDGVFSMVFDGHPSGKAVVIQSVDLGDGTRTITIRLEDI